jgi:glycerol-3-phosphate dehydrogenase (NAD(P)+)
MKFGIFGSGSWGTALAKILTDNGHSVCWCIRSEKIIEHIKTRHHNPKYLSSVYFNLDKLSLTTSAQEVYNQSDFILFATPSAYTIDYIYPFKDQLHHKKIISAVKGILPSNNGLMNDYLKTISGFDEGNYITIMGPCHAEEVAAEKLSYLTFSSLDKSLAVEIANCFKTDYINTIISTDVNGVQYASVLKNIYALGSGILHGLGYGDNFQSVFVANAAAEMQEFLSLMAGKTLEAVVINYNTSVYLGDLLVTCYSLFSRNRSFGNMIGKGYSVEATKLAMQMVAEGYPSSKSIYQLSQSAGIAMPIADSIFNILWEGKNPQEAFNVIEKNIQ